MENRQAVVSTEELIELWLHGKAPNTIAAYRRYAQSFVESADKPLAAVTLIDLQAWQLTLSSRSASSQKTAMAAIKSLLSFARELGLLQSNLGKLVTAPKVKNTLAEKILRPEQVEKMLSLEPSRRNRVLLKLLYAAGLRVSELCALTWRDLKPRAKGGQITVFGKGSKTRAIVLGENLWQELLSLAGDVSAEAPVFKSRSRSSDGSYHLNRKHVYRLVREAARRAGIEGQVSPHWLRHSHASHSLSKGAPINLVRDTLGHSSISVTEKYLHVMPDDSSALYFD